MSDSPFPNVTQMLIDAGLMDAAGNWLVDPVTGQPITPATAAKPTTATWDDFASRYAKAQAAFQAGGKTEADWAKSSEYAALQAEQLQVIRSTTDVNLLTQAQTWRSSQNMNDANYGASWKAQADATAERLKELSDPLHPYLVQRPGGAGDRTETQLTADRQFLIDQSNASYTQLRSFMAEQSRYTTALADQIRLSRDFAIPRPPEQSGTFIAGGASQAANAPRVGISDLLIRY